MDRILERIRGSPVVHADETGWREDGANGYVWTFSTPAQRYFLRRGRNKEVVDEVLDESFSGVLVSDFYAAYHHYPGLKQRCWVHLLRDIHDLKSLTPKTGNWPGGRRQSITFTRWPRALPIPKHGNGSRSSSNWSGNCWPSAVPTPRTRQPPKATCADVSRGIKELFVFVAAPGMPSDNNAAERSLRPLVISRKIRAAPARSAPIPR